VFAGWIVAATLAFAQPLIRLMLYASESPLLSYIPLIPFVAAYLLFMRRARLTTAYRSSIGPALLLGGIGGAALAAAIGQSGRLSVNDGLAVMTFAYLCVLAAGGFLFLGASWMASAAFPAAFLLFMIPLPDAVVYQIESASVLASAEVSAWFFRMTGTPLLRDGTLLGLPGITLHVARECSGIHSSWVLFITSLVASYLFLESPWRRLIFVAFVFPLAIARNAFRILVIGLLCVHIGPHMVESYIHRQGGPIFFALSLVPLFMMLLLLKRQER
jgi:exosortase C (VPDSG-CTERM-specific)